MGRGAASARQGERKGDFLAGKYLLEDCLGIGGMGEVYRATNVSLGRKVAIKLLSAEFVHIEDDVLRFLREARAAAGIRHTNVVDVLDVARDDDGTPFIVQELLAGEDLERYLRTRGKLSPEEALEIMIPVADAIAAAHAQNVVHRDLKPANIFLARERSKITPKVLDFGACLFPTIAERSAKDLRMLIGTPHYMSPEQIVSKADVDARSDVWALGVMLYEMLVGETPFEAETANAVLALVKTRDVPPLRERAKDAPPELEELIALCTKRDHLARLADAGIVHDRMLAVRARLRGTADASRTPTMTDIQPGMPSSTAVPTSSSARPRTSSSDAQRAVENALAAPRSGVGLGDVVISAPTGPRKNKLLTLNSPLSDPPDLFEDALDHVPAIAPLRAPPASTPPARMPSSPPAPAESRPATPRVATEPFSSRMLDGDDSAAASTPLDLAVEPASWPSSRPKSARPPAASSPTVDTTRSRLADVRNSSIPPILDPRASQPSSHPPANTAQAAPPSAQAAPSSAQAAPVASPTTRTFSGPRPVLAHTLSSTRRGWTPAEHAKLALAIAVPAMIAFAVVRLVPDVGAPIGRALRGDSPLASGVLTVLALVGTAIVTARSILGEKKDRWLYIAAGSGVLLGIVMIIVTFSASEAAELGVPSSMGGLSTMIGPIPAIALAAHALGRARAAWLDPYARAESFRFTALASLGVFLALALSPIGSVRTAPTRTAPTTRAAGS